MKKLSDMNQDELGNLFVKKEHLSDFVKQRDIKNFCTRVEIENIADKASEHSTKRIESAIETTISKCFMNDFPKAMNNELVKVGINPENPLEMQDIIGFVRDMKEKSKVDGNAFRGTAIKISLVGLFNLITFGVGLWVAKTANIIK